MSEPSGHEMQLVLNGHVSNITALSFSLDALIIASGCSRGWLNVWSLQVRYDITFEHCSYVSVARLATCTPRYINNSSKCYVVETDVDAVP